MSLSKRLILSVLIFLICTGLLGAAALTGMWGMSTHFKAAAEQYDQLRSLYEIGHRSAGIRQLLSTNEPNRAELEKNLTAAILELQELKARQEGTTAHQPGHELQAMVASIEEHLQRAARRVSNGADLRAAAADINATLGHVASLAGAAKSGIIENRQLAASRLTTTIQFMGILFGATVLVGVMVGFFQYRSVMKPVRSLGRAVTQLSRADFEHRIPEKGAREFRLLIRRFNQMSEEIERLHTSMQHQVESKSRQLVRSEQLASVGYLAAGLAHEINNPLGIIAGYAESTLKRLQSSETGSDENTQQARMERVLNIICEEAFRCRDITGELLEMARPRGEQYEPVGIVSVVRRATTLMHGFPLARDRELVLCAEEAADGLTVRGDESQLIQVLINLVTNGLEACESISGRVVITVERQADDVLIVVTDNGCGMRDETLNHAFDPFYTDKARRGLSGTGLGLSVSHAIAERHGGRLYAHSDGPGRGSTLILELPVMVDEKVALHACA